MFPLRGTTGQSASRTRRTMLQQNDALPCCSGTFLHMCSLQSMNCSSSLDSMHRSHWQCDLHCMDKTNDSHQSHDAKCVVSCSSFFSCHHPLAAALFPSLLRVAVAPDVAPVVAPAVAPADATPTAPAPAAAPTAAKYRLRPLGGSHCSSSSFPRHLTARRLSSTGERASTKKISLTRARVVRRSVEGAGEHGGGEEEELRGAIPDPARYGQLAPPVSTSNSSC